MLDSHIPYTFRDHTTHCAQIDYILHIIRCKQHTEQTRHTHNKHSTHARDTDLSIQHITLFAHENVQHTAAHIGAHWHTYVHTAHTGRQQHAQSYKHTVVHAVLTQAHSITYGTDTASCTVHTQALSVGYCCQLAAHYSSKVMR